MWMTVLLLLLLLQQPAAVSATTLYVADYAGQLTTVSLTEKKGNYSLTAVDTSAACAPNPSWLTIDTDRGLLFCLNEGLETTNGSLSSFTIDANGTLTHVQNSTTLSGPVNGVIYGDPSGRRAIALAHYEDSAVSSWLLDGSATFTHNQNLLFTLPHPGPNAARQDAPHPHEAILDPTGQYILVPDLGADLVRIFSYDASTLLLTPLAPLKAAPGSGPRHAAFWNPYGAVCEGCTTYFYLVHELSGMVTGYAVEYKANGAGLAFEVVYNGSTMGLLTPDRIVAPAEVHVTPDNQFLIISNRNDSSFTLPEPDGSILHSDSLTTFALHDDGTLTWQQIWPAGGSFPRQYSMNAQGTLVAVGLQYDQDMVILQRDPTTGLIGEPVARIPIAGNVTCTVWNEEKALGVLGG